jgi:hypothetical protein
MCEGFGMIISKEIKGYFIEPDSGGDISHSDILARLGWVENSDKHLRKFVRVEVPDWIIASFRFDESITLPGWAESAKDDIIALVTKTLEKTAPAYAEYQRVKDTAEAEMIAKMSLINGYVPD